jgi:transcriptional regulator with XRE-family HTH domain
MRKTEVGKLLRKRRLELEISQEAVAYKLGTTPNFISMIEIGQRLLPTYYYTAVCEYLDIKLTDLIEARGVDDFNRRSHDNIKIEGHL